jgi:2-polyprenyl-6-methoxyphenol hydroxylase-like FAD-dependent oxidoreductase
LLNSWSGTVQKVSDIESKLAEFAMKGGATFIRKDDYRSVITKDRVANFMKGRVINNLSIAEQEVQTYFQQAEVIVGADGSHSVVRQISMSDGDEEQRTDFKIYQYLIELKYQTTRETPKRSWFAFENPSCEGFNIETIPGKGGEAPLKPVAIHFFVGKNTYEAFKEATDAKPWGLTQLQEEALKDPRVNNQAQKIVHYLQGLLNRGGCCQEPKIKRLPIQMFKSPQAYARFEDKIVILVGDALSGAVLARGVNKAFREVAQLAPVIAKCSLSNMQETSRQLVHYARTVEAIYQDEKGWAQFKGAWIERGRLAFRLVIKLLKFIFYPAILVVQKVKSLFVKQPTIGELIKQLEGTKKA